MVDHERLREISKWLLGLIIILIFLTEEKAFGNAAEFHVALATGRIHDSFGRERIFHGLNVVVKGAPWHPRIDAFHPQFSFTDADIVLLKEWGMNVVRLGIMWPGVEPRRGRINSTYLEIMQSIVSKLHSAGIYTLLEFHQDLYAPQFCGEGLPSWILDDDDVKARSVLRTQDSSSSFEETPAAAVTEPLDQSTSSQRSKLEVQSKKEHHKALSDSLSGDPRGTSRLKRQFSNRISHSKVSKMRYPASFPEPLGRRWPWPSGWEQDGWEPSAERCNKRTWWLYYLSYAVSRSFQDLYDNKWGWGDLLARYWTVVAGAFKDEPGVLGYELMNEPWPGNVFSDPLLFLPGVADTKNLAPFYEKLQAAVRSVDSEKILFFETITFDNFRCGLSSVPGGDDWRNKTVLSYHYYTPPNFTAKQAFTERTRESKRLGCGSMLTEFFVSTEQDKRAKREFQDFMKEILRNVVVEEEGREIFSTDSDKDSFEATRAQKTSRTDKSVDGAIHTQLRIREVQTIEVYNRLNSSQEMLKSVGKIDVVASAKKAKSLTDDGHIFIGVGREYEELERRQKAEKVLDDEQERRFTGAVEQNPAQVSEEVDSVDGVLSAADLHIQSWIGWEYKAFFNKTGSIVQQSMFHDDGEVNRVLAKKLARTYPRSVCGNINSFVFNPPSSEFYFSYIAGAECRHRDIVAFTEIFIHRQFYYPFGLSVEVNHMCASVSETDTVVYVKHTVECVGLVIDVRITRKDQVV